MPAYKTRGSLILPDVIFQTLLTFSGVSLIYSGSFASSGVVMGRLDVDAF